MDRIYLRSRRLAVVGLITGLGIAGCGSSSSKPKLTKAQFLSQANAICAGGNAKTNALGASLGNNPSKATADRVIKTGFVPEIQSEISAIRALAVQTADKSRLNNMLDLAQADLEKVKANPALLIGSASTFHDFASQAHAYGLTKCAQQS